MKNFRQWMVAPFAEEQRGQIEHNLALSSYRVHRVVCFVILCFQGLMIAVTLIGGQSFSSRSGIAYFSLYVALFVLSLLAFFVCRQVMQHAGRGRADRNYLSLQALYGLLITLWGIAITLLDQSSGKGLEVYSYVSLAVASFVLFRPWQSIALFGGEFVLLNILLNIPPTIGGDVFGQVVNSLFISVLAIVISIVCYRGKCATYLDKMTIEAQYEKISEMNLRLNELALTDDLTGMYNRRYLDSLPLSPRWLEAGQIAGMMIDIDYFKRYNDTYGHVAGDDCLRLLSQIIGDFAAEHRAEVVRYGGEEFFLCLFDCDPETARQGAEQLRRAVEEQCLAADRLTISIGLCLLDLGAEQTFDDLLRRADEALYEAKRLGRNRVVTAS